MNENTTGNKGWIQLHRKLLDNPLWQERREFSKAEAWIDLLLNAQHSYDPQEVIIGTYVLYCYRGQCLKSLDTWASRWNWSKSKVRRVLQLFQKLNMIQTQSETKTTRITVLNYDSYNTKRNADETQVKRDRNASETRSTPDNNVTTKQCNNDLLLDSDESMSSSDDDWYKAIVDKYNNLASELQLSRVEKLSPKRKKAINARKKQGMLKRLDEIFDIIRNNDFLQGIRGRDSWKGADFDWLFCSPDNWIKIVEGKYDEKQKELDMDKPI